MQYKIFQYPLPAPEELDDLNAWLTSHRVMSVQHHLVEEQGSTMLVFIVQWLEGGAKTSGKSNEGSNRSRVDYKQVLSEDEFARFSKLREMRKTIANEQGVPLYTIFTNEQLATMAKSNPVRVSEWAKIEGVGEARMSKYSERMLASIKESKKENDEQ